VFCFVKLLHHQSTQSPFMHFMSMSIQCQRLSYLGSEVTASSLILGGITIDVLLFIDTPLGSGEADL